MSTRRGFETLDTNQEQSCYSVLRPHLLSTRNKRKCGVIAQVGASGVGRYTIARLPYVNVSTGAAR